MIEVILFVKDFELASKLSAACIDIDRHIEFTDENTDPNDFSKNTKMSIIDLDEKVFASVGLISELRRKGLKIIGTMNIVNNKDALKFRSAGCDVIISRASLVKNIPTLVSELIA
ncbi:MAG: hypothetical protein CMG60_00510 [Candidatus Marinimicrobia bacterium]|nr:hypothetical protein [Candidatus Neomarinimicrobiota bacterium]